MASSSAACSPGAFALTVFEIYKDLHEFKKAACDVDFRCRRRRLP